MESPCSKYVNIELRTNVDSLKEEVKNVGIIRKVKSDMPWEEVFKLHKINLDEKQNYKVVSRQRCIITSVKKSVGEHIQKFVVPLQLYPVSIELTVKKEPVDKTEGAEKQELSSGSQRGNGGVVNAMIPVDPNDKRPRHVIVLESLLRQQLQEMRDANQNGSAGDADEDNYSSSDEIENMEPEQELPYDNSVNEPVEPIIWTLPTGQLLAAGVIETPNVESVPFLDPMQIKKVAGMLVNRFGLEFVLQKKFEFVEIMTDAPELFNEMREKSRFMCDLITAVFSDEMFNPTPTRDEDFI